MSEKSRGKRRRWLRVAPSPRETAGAALVAGMVAAGAGVVTFYLTRLFLAREPLDGPPGGLRDHDGENGAGGA